MPLRRLKTYNDGITYARMVTRKRKLWGLVVWAITVVSGVLSQEGPQAPDNTVQVCYNNQLSFVDTGFGQLNYPLTVTQQKTCSCNVALSGVSENTTATLRVKLTGTTTAASVCRSRLQVFTPQKLFRLLCSYPVNSSFDLPISDSGRRMLFSQDAGTMQMKFSLVEGSGTVLISCTGDPLPSVTPRIPTSPVASPTVPTFRPTPTNTGSTRQRPLTTTTSPPTRRNPTSQPTAQPTPLSARPTPSTARPAPSTARLTSRSVASLTPSTARTTPSTARPARSTARPTPQSARQTTSNSRRTPSPTPNHMKTTSGVQTTKKPSCPVHRDSSAELLFKSYMEEIFFRAFVKCTCKKLQKEYELLKKPVFSMDQEESPPRRRQRFKSSMLTMLWFARKD